MEEKKETESTLEATLKTVQSLDVSVMLQLWLHFWRFTQLALAWMHGPIADWNTVNNISNNVRSAGNDYFIRQPRCHIDWPTFAYGWLGALCDRFHCKEYYNTALAIVSYVWCLHAFFMWYPWRVAEWGISYYFVYYCKACKHTLGLFGCIVVY